MALFWGVGAADEAIEVLLRAEALLDDGPWRRELTAERAVLIAMCGNPTIAIELSRPLLDDPAPRVSVTAAIAASVSMSLGSRCVDAARLSREAQVRSRGLSDQPMLSAPEVHVVAEAMALTEVGDLADAEQLASAGRAFSVAEGLRDGQAWFALVLGRIQLTSGELTDAISAFDEAAGGFAQLHSNGPRRWALAGRVLCAALLGDVSSVEQAWTELANVPEHPAQVMNTEVRRAAAWRERVCGDRTTVATMLYAAAEDALERGQFALAAGALHDVVRLDVVDCRFTIDRWNLLDDVQGELGKARCRLASAVIASSGGGAHDAATDFLAMGAVLFAVEAETVAASLFRTAGNDRRAAVAQRSASDLHAHLDGEWLLTLDRTSAPSPLTEREREVATLAAYGHSNRQIAASLALSVRTVENHLQRIYIKLGIRSRGELGLALV